MSVRRSHPTARRAFSLMEVLAVVVLLSAFALLASRVFMASMDLTRRSQAAQKAFGQVDYAVALLRQDLWNARGVRAADPQHLLIEQAGGRTIRWRYQPAGDDGPAAWWRTVNGGSAEKSGEESARLPWAPEAPQLSFTTDAAGVVLHLTGRGVESASRLRLVSQVQLAREVRR
jgi:prepilin-type N-terminal cleavage/methylation domain-containing protein